MHESLRQLARSTVDRKIGGVCSGLGKYTPLPSWMWRALFVMFIFFGAFGPIAYVCLWIFMPLEGFQNR